MTAVLIIDRDLGFLFWLGDVLHRAGYAVVPATNCGDATRLLEQRQTPIQVLVMDGTLPGAAALVVEVRGKNPRLKVIGLVSEGREPAPFAGANRMLERMFGGRVSEADWIKAIEGVLAHNGASSGE